MLSDYMFIKFVIKSFEIILAGIIKVLLPLTTFDQLLGFLNLLNVAGKRVIADLPRASGLVSYTRELRGLFNLIKLLLYDRRANFGVFKVICIDCFLLIIIY
jgi:hypothetical protein